MIAPPLLPATICRTASLGNKASHGALTSALEFMQQALYSLRGNTKPAGELTPHSNPEHARRELERIEVQAAALVVRCPREQLL
jgi:hypothetical protein